MEYDFEDAVALLARTPATLDAFLRHLPESWTRSNEGAKTWSVFDILGHLIHGERADWMPRARMILQFGESKAFEPFDRLAQERDSQGKSLAELLDQFALLRTESLDQLRDLICDLRTGAGGTPPSMSLRCHNCWQLGPFMT